MYRRGFISLLVVISVSGCSQISNLRGKKEQAPAAKQTPLKPQSTSTEKEGILSRINIFKKDPKPEPLVDTDGDGMVDSKDYAPWDPNVQRKSDVSDVDSVVPPAESPPRESPPAESPPAESPPVESSSPSQPTNLPQLELANLVSSLGSITDVTNNKLTSSKAGDSILIAFKYRALVHPSGTYKVLEQITITNNSTSAVVQTKSKTSEKTGNPGDVQVIAHAIRFSTTSLSPGTYNAKIILQDKIDQKVSNVLNVEFTLT
jgi:hypothetical protein